MARVIVMGAGVGGMPAAYDLKKILGRPHEVVMIGTSEHFQFTPSSPWVTVGWRKPDQVLVPIRPNVERKDIRFIAQPVTRIEADQNTVHLADGESLGILRLKSGEHAEGEESA